MRCYTQVCVGACGVMSNDRLLLYLNGVQLFLTDVDPEASLLQFIRSKGLTGTKLGCGEVLTCAAPHARVVSSVYYLLCFHS